MVDFNRYVVHATVTQRWTEGTVTKDETIHSVAATSEGTARSAVKSSLNSLTTVDEIEITDVKEQNQ